MLVCVVGLKNVKLNVRLAVDFHVCNTVKAVITFIG